MSGALRFPGRYIVWQESKGGWEMGKMRKGGQEGYDIASFFYDIKVFLTTAVVQKNV